MKYDSNFNSFVSRFYSSSSKFTKFSNFEDEQIEKLDKIVEEFNNQNGCNYSIDKYAKLLGLLIYRKDLSYDEKVYLLINIMDPELVIYQLYRQSNIISKAAIDAETNTFVKNDMNEERNNQIRDYESSVREKIGFYNPKLVNFEASYYKHFCKKLIFKNKKNEMPELIAKLISNPIRVLSNDNYQSVVDQANEYISNYPYATHQDIAFHLLHQNDILGFKNYTEQIIFLLTLLDKNFNGLDIYLEESTLKVMVERSKKELGFYYKGLFQLEKEFVKKYPKETGKTLELKWK